MFLTAFGHCFDCNFYLEKEQAKNKFVMAGLWDVFEGTGKNLGSSLFWVACEIQEDKDRRSIPVSNKVGHE
jgi:hypothetical protein